MIPNYAERPHSELPLENLENLLELARICPAGDIVEVGVYRGGSAWFLSRALKGEHRLHLFDTFEGIPEKSPVDRMEIKTFHGVDLEQLRLKLPHAVFHVGVFPDTLTSDVKDLSFVHVDCDQYATCRSSIELLWPRLVPGGIIAFDDYPFEGIKQAIHGYFDPLGIKLLTSTVNIPYVVKTKE